MAVFLPVVFCSLLILLECCNSNSNSDYTDFCAMSDNQRLLFFAFYSLKLFLVVFRWFLLLLFALTKCRSRVKPFSLTAFLCCSLMLHLLVFYLFFRHSTRLYTMLHVYMCMSIKRWVAFPTKKKFSFNFILFLQFFLCFLDSFFLQAVNYCCARLI